MFVNGFYDGSNVMGAAFAIICVGFAIICVGSVACNILLLWIVIKLYTEIMKILNFNAKKKEDIKDIVELCGLSEDDIEYYGKNKVKISLDVIEKLKGKDFDTMHDLKMKIYRQLKAIGKNKWLLSVSQVVRKPNGTNIIKMIGSGNNTVNIVWGEGIVGDFAFSTGTTLIAVLNSAMASSHFLSQ